VEVVFVVLLVLLLKSADKTDKKSEENTPSALELELTMIRYDVPVVAACKSRQTYGSGLGKREASYDPTGKDYYTARNFH